MIDHFEPRLRAIDEDEASERRHEGAWAAKEILGHLLDSAANNHQRFVRAQAEPYLELPSYDQEFWVRSQCYYDESWSELLDLWTLYNRHLVHVLRNVPPEARENRCKIGDGEPVTLEFIAVDYLRHMQHHLEQILATS